MTNVISGKSFEILKGRTGVKVIFTPVHNYRFKDAQETGVMSDFASAANVPWAEVADKVTAVQVANDVTLGKNALAGFADEVLVSSTSSIGSMKNAIGGSEPVVPEGMVLVSKEEIAAAKAETVTVDGGAVSLNGVIEVPAPGKQGFFILKSKPAVK